MIQQIEEDTGTLPASLPRGVAPEVAAANADVQAIIQPRLTMLMEIANTFLTTIIESMETVPYGIRWICKQIKSLTRVCTSLCLLVWYQWASLMIAKVPRCGRRVHLVLNRWILLLAVHKSRYCHSASVHAGRWRTGETSAQNLDPGEFTEWVLRNETEGRSQR